MGKRKLRSCANCGGRHGPPTGKNCTHSEPPGRKEVEEKREKPETGAAAILDTSEEDLHATFEEAGGADGPDTDDELAEFTLPHEGLPTEVGASCDHGRIRPESPAGSGAMGARFLRQHLKEMQRERLEFEKNVDVRLLHMENVMGKVAGVQQAQLQRLLDMTTLTSAKSSSDPVISSKEFEPAAAAAAAAAAAPEPPRRPEASLFNLNDLSDTTVPAADEEWKSYHGFAAWHLENEKKKRNPFDHQAYVKKGERVTSFEDLMTVTFKTLGKTLEMKGDIKGLITHGQFMAEKAAKNVFVDEAFVAYDEGVRKRAGESGPSAFSDVQLGEVFMHFCYENTKKQRAQNQAQGKQQSKAQCQKSDKTCLRFNDAGCTSKSCTYVHRCQGCDSYGHGKKNCTNADKKKEGK